MTTDDPGQTMEVSQSDPDPAMDVSQSEPRENYNKVVFRKPFTIALPVTEGNDTSCEDTRKCEMSSPELERWRTRQEAERERIRNLDHTPQPPQRPPKKPHLRPDVQNGEVKMMTVWKSNSEQHLRPDVQNGEVKMMTAWKSNSEQHIRPDVQNGEPKMMTAWKSNSEQHLRPDVQNGEVKMMTAWKSNSELDSPSSKIGLHSQMTSKIYPQIGTKPNGVKIKSKTHSGLPDNFCPDDFASLNTRGNVVAKCNLFAPKPFKLNTNGNNKLSLEKQTITTSKTFPSLNKFLQLDQKNVGFRSVTGPKPILAPKPFIKSMSPKQTQLEPQNVVFPSQSYNDPSERDEKQETSPTSTAFSSQAFKMNKHVISKPSKKESDTMNNCDSELRKPFGEIEDILNCQPGTTNANKRSTIYRPASNQNCDSIVNLHSKSALSPPKEIKSPSQPSSSDLNNLVKEKEKLLRRLSSKLIVIKEDRSALKEEIKQNEEIGKKLIESLSKVAQMAEVDKLSLHIAEMDKMTNLLIGLSGRLARTEAEMESLAVGEDTDEKKSLHRKREKLVDQLMEAKKLKSMKNKMADKVQIMLRKYLTEGELEEYNCFVSAKERLTIDLKEVDEKIKLGDQQMDKLQCHQPL